MSEKLKVQSNIMLVDILKELNKVHVPGFEYPTRIFDGVQNYYLEELVPRIEKRKILKNKAVNRGRIAIQLYKHSDTFTVYQPRWLVPLQEEIAAIESLLPNIPEITTEYVVYWRNEKYRDIIYPDGLVPELDIELSEARQQYWIAKANEISTGAQKQLNPADD